MVDHHRLVHRLDGIGKLTEQGSDATVIHVNSPPERKWMVVRVMRNYALRNGGCNPMYTGGKCIPRGIRFPKGLAFPVTYPRDESRKTGPPKPVGGLAEGRKM